MQEVIQREHPDVEMDIDDPEDDYFYEDEDE